MKKPQSSNKNNNDNMTDVLVVCGLTLTVVIALWSLEKKITETKKYATFESFYPFYISQHRDSTCCLLHFIGTSLMMIVSLFHPSICPSILIAVGFGLPTFYQTQHFSGGIIEMIVLFMTFQTSMRVFTKTWMIGSLCLLIAYGFAWVGHFFFELNKPATFIYPTYSLLGDFKLWFEILSLQRKLTF